MKYYSAIKENKIMKFAGRRMDLEKIKLSELTQFQKDKYLILLLFIIPNSIYSDMSIQNEVLPETRKIEREHRQVQVP